MKINICFSFHSMFHGCLKFRRGVIYTQPSNCKYNSKLQLDIGCDYVTVYTRNFQDGLVEILPEQTVFLLKKKQWRVEGCFEFHRLQFSNGPCVSFSTML